MKWNCDLIQDLLPLYEEDLCSPASRQAVQEHLCECKNCHRLTAPLPIAEPVESPAADRAVKKSIRKVKIRWLASLLAALLTVPLLLLGFNQYRGYGPCYTNLDDVYTARRFLHALETEDWEKAARMHDYSGAYESITEALSLDVADWSRSFVPFRLVGQPYAARNTVIPETLEDLYSYLYNLQGNAMVPMELWEQLMTIDPGAFHQNGWQYWLNGALYGKITTDWGEFVVSDGQGYDTAYEYCTHFDLVPAAIYEEAKPALEEEALRLYTSTHDNIGWVAGLTESEFTEEMIRRYTAELSSLEGIASFDCTGFRSIERYGEHLEGWCVIFAVTVIQDGKTLDTEISICVTDGKIEVAGVSHDPGVQWLYAIDRSLYPSAHPWY